MYLTRNQSPSQCKVQLEKEIVSRMVEATRFVNPYSCQKVTPYSLVMLLSSLHQQKNLLLKNVPGAYIPGAKKLLEGIGSDNAIECLMLSACRTQHPWSFKFVLKLAEDFVCKRDTVSQIIEDICNGSNEGSIKTGTKKTRQRIIK